MFARVGTAGAVAARRTASRSNGCALLKRMPMRKSMTTAAAESVASVGLPHGDEGDALGHGWCRAWRYRLRKACAEHQR